MWSSKLFYSDKYTSYKEVLRYESLVDILKQFKEKYQIRNQTINILGNDDLFIYRLPKNNDKILKNNIKNVVVSPFDKYEVEIYEKNNRKGFYIINGEYLDLFTKVANQTNLNLGYVASLSNVVANNMLDSKNKYEIILIAKKEGITYNLFEEGFLIMSIYKNISKYNQEELEKEIKTMIETLKNNNIKQDDDIFNVKSLIFEKIEYNKLLDTYSNIVINNDLQSDDIFYEKPIEWTLSKLIPNKQYIWFKLNKTKYISKARFFIFMISFIFFLLIIGALLDINRMSESIILTKINESLKYKLKNVEFRYDELNRLVKNKIDVSEYQELINDKQSIENINNIHSLVTNGAYISNFSYKTVENTIELTVLFNSRIDALQFYEMVKRQSSVIKVEFDSLDNVSSEKIKTNYKIVLKGDV